MSTEKKSSRRETIPSIEDSRSRSDALRLLRWYDGARRELPWRETSNPYEIWVSEIMLQQTRVRTVIPYYRRFLERFPTVDALAAASIEEVLASWSGLGYYRRARQLHAAAQQIEAGGGKIPETYAEWLTLPGIGPYTAAAIASIAFGEYVPVLDGNVERLLTRRLAWEGEPKKAAGKKVLLAAAARLLEPSRAGDSNQALMELGARICIPRAPRCDECPLREGCRARMEGDPEQYPTATKRRPTERIDLAVAVARRKGKILMYQRPKESSLMAELWELPNVPTEQGANRESGLESDLSARYGGVWTLDPLGLLVEHQVTFRALKLHLYSAVVGDGGEVGEGLEAAWVDPADPSGFAMSSMVKKILDRLPSDR